MLGLRVLAGRVFDRDHGEDVTQIGGGTPNVVIDRDLAEDLGFPAPTDALDRQIYLPASFMAAFGGVAAAPMRVIGVVENKPLSITRIGVGTMYSFAADPSFAVVRISRDDVAAAVEAIDTLWERLAPAFPPNRRFVDENFNELYSNYARLDYAFTALAAFALLISAAGLLAMSMLVVGRRMREIGVRKCLGASSPQVVSMLLKDFSVPVGIANLISWPLTFLAARDYLSLFALPFAASLIASLTIAWLAVGTYTLRAARTVPAEVLRNE